jgi:hypothetical protein
MPDIVDFVRVIVPSVVIPAAVFGGNWAIRHKLHYTQTAAADFILAVLIFDGTVVTTTTEFEPFIRNQEFRQIAVHLHIVLAVGFVGASASNPRH